MGSGKKILIVEDNEINQDMLSRRLLRRGYEIVLANDGAEGCSLALSEQPDLILMDMSLPVMDGWEATRRLKADARTSSIPIMALTAHAMVGDLEKALVAGCDDYHTKPIDLPQLLQKMETLLAKSQPAKPTTIKEQTASIAERQPSPPAAVTSEAASKTLLVVDDNEANRDMLGRRLERAGYRILLAESGEEGLNILQQQPVDLVLLDIMMPGISGLDTLKAIRQMYSKVQLPVLMATAKDESDDIVQAFELGANDYITKPIDFPVALARIHSQLNTIQAARQDSIAKPAAEESTELAASQAEPATPLLLRRYQMGELLIQNEFSQIYLAQDTQQPTNSNCAIEQVTLNVDRPELWESARDLLKAERDRFKLLGKNDNVLVLLNSFEQEQKFYLVQEFTAGTLLSEDLASGDRQDLRYAVNLVTDALKILAALHQHHLAHQHLQPSSFLRRQTDRKLVLLDSGIAARLNQTWQQKYGLQQSTDSSTPMYAAPKPGIGQMIFSNDIYSVGAIALHFFTGISPQKALGNPKISKIFWEHVAQKDRGLAQILQKMTQEEPQERYLSARDALSDILELSKDKR